MSFEEFAQKLNCDLEARTRPMSYDLAIKAALEAGVTKEEIARQIADYTRIAESLLEGKCPECGAPSTRYVDRARQWRVSSVSGTWVMYRCSTQAPPGKPSPPGACKFMVDLREGGEAN